MGIFSQLMFKCHGKSICDIQNCLTDGGSDDRRYRQGQYLGQGRNRGWSDNDNSG